MRCACRFAYAQARIQARFARLPGEEDWERQTGMRGLAGFLEEARSGPKREPNFDLVHAAMGAYAEGGALEFEVVDKSDDGIDMDVTRCRYAELMESLGARDLGPALVCNGDFAAAAVIGATPIVSRVSNRIERAQIEGRSDATAQLAWAFPVVLCAVLLASIASLAASTQNPFIYFRF